MTSERSFLAILAQENWILATFFQVLLLLLTFGVMKGQVLKIIFQSDLSEVTYWPP